MDRDLLLFIKHTDTHIEEARNEALYKKTHHPNCLKVVFRSVVMPLGFAITKPAFTLQGRCA